MAADDVFAPEMPEDFESPIDPLDDDTAERLLTGRLHPDDAPPPYAAVVRALHAAAGPPTPEELAGEAAALAAFRSAGGSEGRGQAGAARERRVMVARPGSRGRGAGGRARLVAMALAGALAVGGLWMAAGAQTAPGLPSRFGGPGSGGSGSGAAGSGAGGTGAGGSGVGGADSAGSLRPTMPATGLVSGERPAAVPPDRDPAAVRPGGASGIGGAQAAGAHRSHPGHPHKPPKPKPEKPEPKKPKPNPKPKGGKS